MKTIYNKYILAVLFICFALTATAQTTNSSYFVDGYLYRHQLNPAYGNDQNYITFPAIGNLDISLNGNLNLTDVLYKVNGQTTTFLNPSISTAEVMGNLSDQNKLGTDIKIGLLGAGFKAFGGYNTIGINIRSNVNTSIPKSLFSLHKEGISNKTYDITGLHAHADAYAEIALGHSRKINDKWRVGGAFKFLVGAGNIDAIAEKTMLTLGEDNWSAVTNATIQSNIKGSYFTEDYQNGYVDGIDIENPGIAGFGAAFDLGAIFTLNQDWQFSASILDLGFIKWDNNVVASTNGDKSFELDKYTFNVDKNAPNNFEDEWELVKNDLEQLYHLDNNGNIGSRTKMLGATLNFAAEYTLPVYRKLKFGLLNSTRLQDKNTWTEFRLSANVAPVKIFSASANFAVGSYGCAFGWLLDLHTTGFNLFVGMDQTYFKFAKQGIPLASNMSVNFGINIPF